MIKKLQNTKILSTKMEGLNENIRQINSIYCRIKNENYDDTSLSETICDLYSSQFPNNLVKKLKLTDFADLRCFLEFCIKTMEDIVSEVESLQNKLLKAAKRHYMIKERIIDKSNKFNGEEINENLFDFVKDGDPPTTIDEILSFAKFLYFIVGAFPNEANKDEYLDLVSILGIAINERLIPIMPLGDELLVKNIFDQISKLVVTIFIIKGEEILNASGILAYYDGEIIDKKFPIDNKFMPIDNENNVEFNYIITCAHILDFYFTQDTKVNFHVKLGSNMFALNCNEISNEYDGYRSTDFAFIKLSKVINSNDLNLLSKIEFRVEYPFNSFKDYDSFDSDQQATFLLGFPDNDWLDNIDGKKKDSDYYKFALNINPNPELTKQIENIKNEDI